MSTALPKHYFGKDLEAMSFARNYHAWILDEFAPFVAGRVAEVGAGSGNFSKLLLASGIDSLTAFEPSDNMYPLLTQALAGFDNAETSHGVFNVGTYADVNTFETIFYVNVLEHIDDDRGELAHVYRRLSNGGHVCIFVPALSWLYSPFDAAVGHFRRYHKKPLVSVARAGGFEVVKVRYFDLLGIAPWYLAFVLMKRTLRASSVSLYDRLAVPVARAMERVVTPPIGRNLILVGRKTTPAVRAGPD